MSKRPETGAAHACHLRALPLSLALAALSGTEAQAQSCITLGGGALFANNTECTVTTGSSITSNVVNVPGLRASGAAASISADSVTVQIGGGNAAGVLAQDGAQVTGVGSTVRTTGATTAGAALGSHGVQATGTGTRVQGQNVQITASGARANGVNVDGGAQVQLMQGSSITSSSNGSTDLAPSAGAFVGAAGTFEMTSGSIAASGVRDHGLSVRGAGGNAALSGVTINVTGDRSRAVDVFGGGSATVEGSTLNVSNLGLLGAEVAGDGSQLSINANSSLTTDRKNGIGVRALDRANVTLMNSSITTRGTDATAVTAGSGATITGRGLTITTSGDDTSMGAVAESNSSVTLSDTSVTTSGRRIRGSDTKPHALVARNAGAQLSASNVTVRTLGADGQAIGVVADDGGTVRLQGGSIYTEGTVGLGMFSVVEQSGPQFAAHIEANGTSVQTIGTRGYGADAERNFLPATATLSLTQATVQTSGESAVGLRASTGGALTAVDSSVSTVGPNAFGVLARDHNASMQSSIALTRTRVSTQGMNAHGAVVREGAILTADSSTVQAQGAASSALYVNGEVGTPPSAQFNASQLTNASGPTVGIAGAGTVVLTGTTVGGSGLWLHVGTSEDFPPLAAPDAPLPGAPDQPDPDLEPTSAAAPVAATKPLGAVVAQAGKPGLAMLSASGSTLTGAATTAAGSVSNVQLRAGTTWNMTGSSNLTNLVNDGSRILFSAPEGGTFKTLTVQNYSGANGALIGLHSQLAGDGAPSDRLVLSGGTASGSTGLQFTNAGGAGAVTLANGILVVDAQNGGTTEASSFVQQGRAVAGPYEYRLYRSSIDGSNPQAWYLRSSQQAPSPTPPAPPPPTPPAPSPAPIPPPPPAPLPDVLPLYRPEVGAYLANLRQSGGMFVHSLHDRLGEPQWIETQQFDEPDDKRRSTWLRLVGKDIDSSSRNGQFDVDTRQWLLQGGGDIADWTVFKDKDAPSPDRLHLGAMLGYGRATSDTTAAGNPARAQGTTEGLSVGLYGTWYQNDEDKLKLGSYVDLWGIYGWYRNEVEGELLPTVTYDSRVLALSGETGYAFRARDDSDWILEPQAQLIYVRSDGDGVTEPNGTRIDGQAGNGWISRLGLRVHRTWVDEEGRRTQPYLTVNWWHDQVDNAVAFNTIALRDLYPDNRYEVKLGVNVQRKDGWSGWGNVGYQWGSQSYRALSARVGVKYTW